MKFFDSSTNSNSNNLEPMGSYAAAVSGTKDYYEISVNINPSAIELVTEVFFEAFECEGVIQAEEKYKDLELIETTNNVAKGYIQFEEEKFAPLDIQKIFYSTRDSLLKLGFTEAELGDWSIKAKKVINQDWSKKWKEHWKPMHVSDKIVVCPTWEECDIQNDEILINLDPGSAFGTGTHATTQLCIQAIEKYMKNGDTVADIGTGSGILAITATKCGASKVIGIDNDPLVIDVAIDNAQINNVFNKIQFSHGTADSVYDKFDFVVANILHNVLAEIMGDLKSIMKQGAFMALSGILDEKQGIVLEAVKKHNLEIVEIMEQENWVAIVVKN